MVRDKTDARRERNKEFVRRNEQIRISPIQVIQDQKNLGVMPTRDALNLARGLDLDLVEVSPNTRPPVCRIMDYGKFMYEKSKVDKNKKSGGTEEKEVSFRYVIAEHDLDTKAGQIRGFLEKGMRVKCVVKFKAREKAHKEQGFDLLKMVMEKLQDIAVAERPPAFEGSNVSVRLDRKKSEKEQKKKELANG